MGQLKRRGKIWWLRYYRGNRRYEESSGSEVKKVASDLLKEREGSKLPITPEMARFTFDEGAADLLNEFKANDRRSLEVVQRRIELHLTPYFEGWRLSDIRTNHVRDYVVQRQSETEIVHRAHDVKQKDGTVRRVPEQRRTITRVSNAEINRELTILKRIFSLAMQAEKILHRPHIPLLSEHNTRTGFFEPEQFNSLLVHLPDALRPVVTFAYVTGWRIDSEILPLEWRQVDFQAGEVRLDPGTTGFEGGTGTAPRSRRRPQSLSAPTA
jgi:integrase